MKKNNYYYLSGLILWAVLFLATGYLPLTPVQRILLLIVTILAIFISLKGVRAGLLQQLDKGSWIILVLISLYAGFSCVGNRILLTHIQIKKIIFYLLFTVWIIPIEIAFLYITRSLRDKVLQFSQQRPPSMIPFSRLRSWFLFFSIPFAVGCIYLYAFFPGVMSNDSLSQWGQAIGKYDLNDWHPIFHTLFNRLFITLYHSPASVAMAQIIFLSAVIAGFTVFLCRQGIPRKWVLFFVILFSLLPQLGIYSVTLWKDVPFTASLLWLTLVLTRIVTDSGYLRKPVNGLQLTITLVAVALFRHNGLLAYGLLAAALALYLYKRKYVSGWIYLALSVVLTVGYNLFILSRPGIIPIPKAIKLEAPIHGIAAVMSEEYPLPPGVNKEMESILPRKTWLNSFSPYSAESYQFKTDGVFIDRLSRFSTTEVLQMYGATFIRHPVILTKDRLNGVDFIWDLTRPEFAFNSLYNTGLEPNPFGLVQKAHHPLRDALKSYLAFSEEIDTIFIWRVALYTILLMLTLLLVRMEKRGIKEFLLIFAPLISCILSLLPSMLLQEYRYVYFIFFLFGFLWLLVISNTKVNSD